MKRYIYRYMWFTIGVMINSFGIALITKATLGTSPISSLPYVLSFRFPFTLGQLSFVMNMLFIIAQALLLRKDFERIQFLQIVVNVVFSAVIDVSMSLLSWLEPSNILTQLITLVLGCAVLGVGISIEVAPGVVIVPGEGLVKAISTVFNKRFGTTKIMFDVTLVAIALVLSLIFFHRLQGLGAGTIISALIVGRFVNLYNKKLPLVSYIAGLKRGRLKAGEAC